MRVCYEMHKFFLHTHTHLLVPEAFPLTNVFFKSHPVLRLFKVAKASLQSISHNCTLDKESRISILQEHQLFKKAFGRNKAFFV